MICCAFHCFLLEEDGLDQGWDDDTVDETDDTNAETLKYFGVNCSGMGMGSDCVDQNDTMSVDVVSDIEFQNDETIENKTGPP